MINCKYFNQCGGCFYHNISEKDYRNEKIKFLSQLNHSDADPQWIWVKENSRRKTTLQVSKNNDLGFFKEKSKEIIKIDQCLIARQGISDLIPHLQKLVKTLAHNVITNISITEFDNCLSVIFYLKKDQKFSDNQKLIHFAKQHQCNISTYCNGQHYPLITLQNNHIHIDDFTLNLDPNIFIQATKDGATEIINIIKNEVEKTQNIVDIYCGFGLYSFAISTLSKHISTYEGDHNMIKLIKENIKNNGVKNIQPFQRDLFQNPISARELRNFDLAIINPPRNGATPQIKEIAKSNLEKIIYVSCNPKTFFYDAKILLDSNFKITNLYALDQFYLSKHLELIVIFSKTN